MAYRFPTFVSIIVLSIFQTANAHEFWLETETYTPSVSEDVKLQIFNGEHFRGIPYPYLKDRFFTFESHQGEIAHEIDGLEGDDDPVTTLSFEQPGLAVIAYHARGIYLVYDTMEMFETFLEKEGLQSFLNDHKAFEKRTADIEERCYRAAKLFLNIGGNGEGKDIFTGMPLELVAERNPYALGLGEELPVRLLQDGQPVAGVLVKAFPKSAPSMVQKHWTDTEGRVSIALPVKGPWMLNAVQLFEPEPNEGVDWISVWASLTFERR